MTGTEQECKTGQMAGEPLPSTPAQERSVGTPLPTGPRRLMGAHSSNSKGIKDTFMPVLPARASDLGSGKVTAHPAHRDM